ncbi:MAG: hypothetical protein J6C87_02025 [Bacteroides sp.]|nr:hypothetical protein [Bacteroides sp.]
MKTTQMTSMVKILVCSWLIMLATCTTTQAQTYYHMWRGSGDAGKPEWISNLANAAYGSTGIEFSTNSITRGFVDNFGRWVLRSQNSTTTPTSLINYMIGMPGVTLGVEGWIASNSLTIREFGDNITNTLDFQTTGTKSIIFARGDTEGLLISSQNKKIFLDGNIGIGFSDVTPESKLHIKDSYIVSEKAGIKSVMGVQTLTSNSFWGTSTANGLYLGANLKRSLFFDTDGSIFAGFQNGSIPTVRTELRNKYSLFVKGGVLAEDLAIAPTTAWADYVFDKNYELKTLSEVEAFIEENKHLPDVPSADEVAEKGYSQREINKILLQKIEELTLYTIQQQKEIEELRNLVGK